MTVGRMARVLVGLLLLGAAAVVAAMLYGGGSWLGLVGCWGLVGIPGLMILAGASGDGPRRFVVPIFPAAVSLLGLDVIDSSRRVVVVSGYVWFTALSVTAVLLAVAAYRRRNVGPALK